MQGKLIIFSAPSGSGKTTIVNELISHLPNLEFSISATSRQARKGETDGRHYYFLEPGRFIEKVKNKEFIEWEEVYENYYYGTLKSEIERIWKAGKHVIFDIDVKGAINLKKQFKERALSVFVEVPSMEELEKRLRGRSTETEDKIRKRLAKAQEEMKYKSEFDVVILNNRLDIAIEEAIKRVEDFIDVDKI